jgi:hypothetical protein
MRLPRTRRRGFSALEAVLCAALIVPIAAGFYFFARSILLSDLEAIRRTITTTNF